MTALLLALASAASLQFRPADDGPMDWPQWRGPSRDGTCPGPAWPEKLTPENLVRSWQVRLGKGYASPIVAGDRVFTVETEGEEREVVRCLDRQTGEELWSTSWVGAMKVPFFAAKNGSWIRSTPAWDGKNLFVGGMRDHLVCLDGETGEIRWQANFMERSGTPLPSFGLVCSPLIDGEDLYIQAGGGLVKLDKNSGEEHWRTLADGGGMESAFSSPVLATLHGQRQLLVSTRSSLCGVSIEDGTVLWDAPIKSFRGMNILTPSVVGDGVFTSAYGGRSQLLMPERTETGWTVGQAWEARPRGYMTSPVIVDGHAYLFLQSNRFTCVRLSDGDVGWITEPLGDEYWSLVSQGDRILALTQAGELILIRADPSEYVELGRVTVSEQQTWGHLAVSGNEVVIRELEAVSLFTWK